MRVAILAHDQFPDRAKTAVGLLRYGDHEVVCLLDRETASDCVRDYVSGVQDAPIVSSMAEAPPCDALIIGIAPIGGDFDPTWRGDVRTALERECDVIAGLHKLLNEDDEFVALADRYDCTLHDVRSPPDDLSVAAGTADDVDAQVVLTVGTDCSTGKMTAAYELRNAARERGLSAAVVPTGQTAIMIEGAGIAIDRVISDFAAGAVERLVHERAENDVLFVEGQGALAHPAYSGVTTAILHGAQPDSLVLCHEAGREAIHGYESFPIQPVDAVAALYETVAAPVTDASVDLGLLNTRSLDDDRARTAVRDYGDALSCPATDPIRYGLESAVDAVI